MWIKMNDDKPGISFMPRNMDPLEKQMNPYDNMVEDEELEEEDEKAIVPQIPFNFVPFVAKE